MRGDISSSPPPYSSPSTGRIVPVILVVRACTPEYLPSEHMVSPRRLEAKLPAGRRFGVGDGPARKDYPVLSFGPVSSVTTP